MVSKKVFSNNGGVVNPPIELFDPFLQMASDEVGITLYRVRSLASPFIINEIDELVSRSRMFCSTLSVLNDIHEGKPDFDPSPSSEDTFEVLKKKAYSAINQSKELGKIYAELLAVLGRDSVFLLEDFDLLFGHYFSDKVFIDACAGSRTAIQYALETVRNSVRVVCFGSELPTAYHWGVYGNSSKGICYVIEDRYEKNFYTPLTPQQVEYVGTKPALNGFDICAMYLFLKLIRNWDLTDLSYSSFHHPFFVAIRRFLFQKSATWAQEKEWRFANFSGKASGYVSTPGLYLRKIIFGPNCEKSDIDKLSAALLSRNIKIPLAQALLSSGYEFSIDEL